MLLALALMAQGVDSNAKTDEAIACGRAIMATQSRDAALTPTPVLQAVYFMMTAAEASPLEGKGFIMRISDFAGPVFGEDPGNLKPMTLAECDRKYPLARSTKPVTLPSNPFQRDLMCGGAASYAFGILKGGGISDDATHYEQLQTAFTARIPDPVLGRNGIKNEDEAMAAVNAALINSLRLGNLEMVLKACSAALDSK